MALKFYQCAHCGNVAVKVFDQGVPLSCCGEAMQELVPNSSGAAAEKHLPQVSVGDTVKVSVSEVAHPMGEDHYITLIALETQQGYQVAQLTPGEGVVAEAEFALLPGDKSVAAYEFCNKHGLWKTEL